MPGVLGGNAGTGERGLGMAEASVSCMPLNSQPSTLNRLSVATVRRLERALGGDPVTEDQVLRFIAARYGAENLFYVPAHVAAAILKRPSDFIIAARRHCQPELF